MEFRKILQKKKKYSISDHVSVTFTLGGILPKKSERFFCRKKIHLEKKKAASTDLGRSLGQVIGERLPTGIRTLSSLKSRRGPELSTVIRRAHEDTRLVCSGKTAGRGENALVAGKPQRNSRTNRTYTIIHVHTYNIYICVRAAFIMCIIYCAQ